MVRKFHETYINKSSQEQVIFFCLFVSVCSPCWICKRSKKAMDQSSSGMFFFSEDIELLGTGPTCWFLSQFINSNYFSNQIDLRWLLHFILFHCSFEKSHNFWRIMKSSHLPQNRRRGKNNKTIVSWGWKYLGNRFQAG